jgi:folate-binding protein YgfZ
MKLNSFSGEMMIQAEEKNIQLVEYLESKGFSAISVNGYKVINEFSSNKNEVNSLYDGVALRNISHQGIVELKGKDSLDLLHRISTNKISDLPKEGVRKTIFTSEKGRIIGFGTLLNFEDYQLLVCGRDNKNKVMSWIRKYIISDDVQVNDGNSKYNLLELSGPQAESFATLICGKIVNDMPTDSFKIMHTENILFFLIKMNEERDQNKFWFLADFDNTKKLIEFMSNQNGLFDFDMVGESAYNSYRIEQGIPAAPTELNDNYNPLEAGLMQYIDFKKGCYIGQEVIARLDTYEKVQKTLTGVRLKDIENTENEIHLYDENGNEAGIVTSLTHSTKLDEPIGLAYIRNAYLKKGTKLTAKVDGNQIGEAEVYTLPFV